MYKVEWFDEADVRSMWYIFDTLDEAKEHCTQGKNNGYTYIIWEKLEADYVFKR